MVQTGNESGKTGGDLLVEGLERWSIDQLFGVPGVQLDQLFDAIQRKPDAPRVYHCRHEQGAAYMAFGYAMATGKPGVCAIVPGPGVLNGGAALATAWACNARVLCLTSTINSAFHGRGLGALHEIEDQTGLLRGLTKWTARARHASEIPGLVDEAFRQLLSGRPRPVALEIPPDILAQRTNAAYPAALPSITKPAVDPSMIDKAAELCLAAKKPMIIVGSGAMDAGDEVRALAEELQAPIVTRNMGRGVVPAEDPYHLPGAAANGMWADTDCVIGIGTRLQQLREWGHDPSLRIVRIDLDYSETNKIALADAAIIADASDGARALADAIATQNPQRESRLEEIAAVRGQFENAIKEELAPQIAYLDALRSEMADDDVLVDEMTQVAYVGRYAFPVKAPRSFVHSSFQGTLGYGFATALGAQVGAGDRQVISINGDGGFMYTMPELATAMLHDIHLIAIVFTDGHFGNVKRIQASAYGGRHIACELHNPDFVALAQSFGMAALRAEGPEGLRMALREAKQVKGPVLIECPVHDEEFPSPWKHIHGRKVR
ncbi:MAG: hypothetical protein H6919_04645 [Sphingomonadaceae bacterium]|nr:hypothetical protein [Sphingomonadaceae bacterium]MCP5383005.1 hypothetical protein [Altererythrobacter sp.]MCP5393188.1 hypothetical protein [Sphingomonadaceae bacterium]